MTDLEQIKHHLARLVSGISAADLEALGGALGKAQNSPPLGHADGSVSAEEWQIASDAVRALDKAKSLARRLL